jgi:hypothetical protein
VTDGRAYALHLSAKGERWVAKAMAAVDAHSDIITGILGVTEMERTVDALQKIALMMPRAV